MVYVAILGHGVVGSGVAEVLRKNADSIAHKAGEPIEIRRILDLREFPDLPYADKFTKEFDDILHDPDIRIVVETMGGLHPAYDFVKSCLLAGKNVVTSNKELVAAKGDELLEIAKNNNLNFLFEASVGGGIPILRPIDQCLAANEVYEIAGILNGTTNFILTKMFREGVTFDSALALAQKLGYAERNPADDVEGKDACRKICILASLAFGSHVYPRDVYAEGITRITQEDVAYAAGCGSVIKLIGRAKRGVNGAPITAMVTPAFVSHDSQLGNVDDVFNGILVRGDATGDVVFYGKGAGKYPTASAVVGDVIECAKATDTSPSLRWEKSNGGNVAPREDNVTAMYLRCRSFESNSLEDAVELFGKVKALSRDGRPSNEAAFITPAATEREIDAACKKLEEKGVTILSKIRVLDY